MSASETDEATIREKLGRAFWAFAVFALVVAHTVALLVRTVGVPRALEPGARLDAVAFLAVVALALLTVWLEDGGYERFGADPTAGGTFAWLFMLYLPVAFAPTMVALSATVEWRHLQTPWLVFALAAVSAALAFYGGLEALEIEPANLLSTGVVAACLGGLVLAGNALLEPAWATSDAATVLGAAAIQLVALWVGCGRVGDRLLETVETE